MRKIQPVSFNMEDIYERRMYEYALEQNKYFSRYVKHLIEKDRNEMPVIAQPVAVVKKEDNKKTRSLVSSFL